jgi:hypothetical protein
VTILEEAEAIVTGPRAIAYGPPRLNLTRIAALWSTYLDRPLTAVDVCHMMVLLKVARAMSGVPNRDTLVDIAGYIRLIEILEEP